MSAIEQHPDSKAFDVACLVRDNSRELRLRVKAGAAGLNNPILARELNRTGMALSGFTELFQSQRIQIIGNTEILFLRTLNPQARQAALERLFNFDLPCVIVTSRNRIPPLAAEFAERRSIPLITSPVDTSDLAYHLTAYLNDQFAPRTTIHGTLVDVYGTGLLFVGRAGIGKSEIAIDLVERGHRLVADDVVNLTFKPPGILIGTGPDLLRHLIEIRGFGVINAREIFGIRAIRLQKRVETVIELTDWDDSEEYERLGLEEQYREFFGLKIPLIQLPIFPGKNITVIAEAIALNHHLKTYGINAARELNRRLIAGLKARNRVKQYLRGDDE